MIESVKVTEKNPDGTEKEIKIDQAAAGYHNYLVMFNALIDLDFAVLRMIQAEYNNPKFIDQTVMHYTTKQVRQALLNREDPNPLSICFKDKETADKIYKEIMTVRYGDLLSEDKYLCITGLFFLISVYSAMKNTHVTIVCGNEREQEIIRRYHKNVNIIIPNALSDINVNEYTEFIFKSQYDVRKFNQEFNEKRILLLNYKFNVTIEDNTVFPEFSIAKWLWENGFSKIAIVDTYSKEDENYANLQIKVKKKHENK